MKRLFLFALVGAAIGGVLMLIRSNSSDEESQESSSTPTPVVAGLGLGALVGFVLDRRSRRRARNRSVARKGVDMVTGVADVARARATDLGHAVRERAA